MREFKFRAWDNSEMFYNVRCGGMFDGIPTAPTVWDEKKKDWVNLTGQPYTKIMQWTGLKDKNEQEIYEGDILKDKNGLGEVKWVQEHSAFLVYVPNPAGYHYLESDGHLKESEIVGNIFENRALLEIL